MSSKSQSKGDTEYRRILENLTRLRQTAGMSQVDLAAKLKWTSSLVKQIEACERRLDPVEFHQYCDAIGQDDAILIKDLST